MDIEIGSEPRAHDDTAETHPPQTSRPRDGVASGSRSHAFTAIMLALIALFGFSLRVTNVNWDQGQHLHPDERFLMIVTDNIHAPESVGQYFDTAQSPLNPYKTQGSFVYGTFPLFLNKAVAEWMDKDPDGNTHASADAFRWVLRQFGVDVRRGGGFTFDGGYNSQEVGRVLSAIFDVFTILLVFELGRALYSRRLGLLASALMSVSVLNIQYSHFFGSETFLVFFMTAVFYFAIRIWKYGSIWNYIFAGLAFGMALGCKLSAMPIIVVPALAVIMRMWPNLEALYARAVGRNLPWRARDALPERVDWSALIAPAAGGIFTLICAGVVFRLVQPYAFKGPGVFDVFRWHLAQKDVLSFDGLRHLEFLKPSHYLDFNPKYRADIDGLINLQSGAVDFPPALQWINRTPYVFPLTGMFFWGYGIPLSLATAGGMAYAAFRLVRRRDPAGLLPLIWIVILFWFIARGFAPTIRYFLPIYPTMALMAAFGILSLWDAALDGSIAKALPARLAAIRPYAKPAGQAVAAIAVVGAFAWAYAFVGVYREDMSRVQASHWISDNVPPGSHLTSNEWDDGLPLNLPGIRGSDFIGVSLKPYGQDSPQKVEDLVTGLDEADYVLETSTRVYGSIPRIPARFPSTVLYYRYLFDGTLGFENVAEFRNYPKILGIEIPDDRAEESFTVYDHPPVTIWKKTAQYSHDRAIQLLRPELSAAAISMAPGDAGQNALQFRPDVLATQKAGGTFSDIYHPGNVINRHPLFFWLLVMELAAFSLVPLSFVAFRGLPDRGFLLTKPLGVLALSYLAYFPSSHGVVHFTRPEIATGLTLLVAIGVATAAWWREEIAAWLRERWRFVLLAETVFLLAFLGAYWLRIQNPDLFHPSQGGEKPMDLAYFTAVTKTTDMSQGPLDPWNAGGYLNYYYYGQFISATITKLLGIVPEVAYNLVVPMFFALAASATFSLTYNLTESTRLLMRRRPGRLPISAKGPIIAGLLAIFLVLVAGNLRAVDVLEQQLTKQSHWHSDISWSLFGFNGSLPLLGGGLALVGGLKETISSGSFREVVYGYDWWAPSRALMADPKEVQPITEFPFWTFLFADLHAHLMAIPFAMTFAGVALGVVLNFSRLNPAGSRDESRRREISSWAIVVVLGIIVGALRWINSWDYPPFLLLGAAALLIAERAKYGSFSLKALGFGLLKIVVMGVVSYEAFAPFARNYSAAYNGFERSQQTTALGDYLSHFGIMLFFITGFLLFALNRSMTRAGFVRGIFFGRSRRRNPAESAPAMAMLIVGAAAFIWVAARHDYGVVGLTAIGLIAVVLVSIRELRSPSPAAPVLLFVYTMIALGLGLCGGVELLTLDGDIGRMNTVFKFYLHVWMVWGVVSAFALWYVFAVMQPQGAFLRRAGSLNAALVRAPRYAFATVVVLLLALTLVYPYFGTRARIHNRFNPAQGASNDGLAFLDKGGPYVNGPNEQGHGGVYDMSYTRDGINWIRANIKGSPTTMEAVGQSYRSLGSRVAIYTGLPTVTGWDFHQIQQRGKFGPYVQKRQADVKEFYTTTDVIRARTILRTYDVEWVIVGDEERFDYPAAGMLKFQDGLSGFLEKVYENPSMQVWHVIPQDQLGTGTSVQAAP